MAAMTGFTSCLLYVSCVALFQCSLAAQDGHENYNIAKNTVIIASKWFGQRWVNEDSPITPFLEDPNDALGFSIYSSMITDDEKNAEFEVKPIVCPSVHLSVCSGAQIKYVCPSTKFVLHMHIYISALKSPCPMLFVSDSWWLLFYLLTEGWAVFLGDVWF